MEELRTITQSQLNTLLGLLVFDRYEPQPASSPNIIIPFDILVEQISILMPDFKLGLPRTGEAPLSARLSSGTQAGEINLPGIIRAVAGDKPIRLDIPTIEKQVFIWVVIEQLQDLRFDPAHGVGDASLKWNLEEQSLDLVILPEETGEEITGSFGIDLHDIMLTIRFRPRIQSGILTWTAKTLFSFDFDLSVLGLPDWLVESIALGIIAGPLANSAVDNYVHSNIHDAVVDALDNIIQPKADLLMKVLFALPFTPREAPAEYLNLNRHSDAVARLNAILSVLDGKSSFLPFNWQPIIDEYSLKQIRPIHFTPVTTRSCGD